MSDNTLKHRSRLLLALALAASTALGASLGASPGAAQTCSAPAFRQPPIPGV